jgi:AraC-like DNA-binding protein
MSEAPVQHLEVLHQGPIFGLIDYRCRLPVVAKGREERAEAHQIVFVRSGLFVRETPRGRVLADANHVLFFNAGEPYTVSHPLPGGDDCLVLTFAERDLMDLLAAVDPSAAGEPDAPFPFSHALTAAGACLLQRRLLSLARIGAKGLELEEIAFELAEAAMRAARESALACEPPRVGRAASSRREATEAVKLILASCLADPPSLRELARRIGYGPFHLVRTFRSEVGLPIRRYLARLRLRLAVERLAEDGEDLTALALDLGYADHSHFTNAFRREFGMSPSRFRSVASVRRLRQLAIH